MAKIILFKIEKYRISPIARICFQNSYNLALLLLVLLVLRAEAALAVAPLAAELLPQVASVHARLPHQLLVLSHGGRGQVAILGRGAEQDGGRAARDGLTKANRVRHAMVHLGDAKWQVLKFFEKAIQFSNFGKRFGG